MSSVLCIIINLETICLTIFKKLVTIICLRLRVDFKFTSNETIYVRSPYKPIIVLFEIQSVRYT